MTYAGRHGPRVVALGGGHGLAATLQAARRYAGAITAVVSVADDGGSSGRLREAFGIPAPGDLRRCLVALGDPDSLWARAFDHRFEAGELEGHAFGNVVIAGLTATTGDFESALEEAGRLVGAVGRVLPATVEPVVLKAEIEGPGPAEVQGQVRVQESSGIRRVSLVPADASPPPEVLDAIESADQIVLGPGSLYTSVLPVVIVPAIQEALRATRAERVYVCNLRPQIPETEGYDGAAHLDALADHGLDVDVVLIDPAAIEPGPMREGPICVEGPYARVDGLGHDPVRLAAALANRLR